MLVSKPQKCSKQDDLKIVSGALKRCPSFSSRVQFVEPLSENPQAELSEQPTEQRSEELSEESSEESCEKSFEEQPFEPSEKSSQLSELSQSTNVASVRHFNSLPVFSVEPFVSPSYLMPSTSEAQEYPGQADLQVASGMWQNPSLVSHVLPSEQTHETNYEKPFPPPPFLLDYSYNSPFATTPRSYANGKARTFGVLNGDSKSTFWNYSSLDTNLRSASLGRQKTGSRILPFRLSQISGFLSIPAANPFARSIANEDEAKNPANAVVPANSLRSPIYAEEQEIDDQEERERMRSIEFLLQDTMQPVAETFELKSSFNHQKFFDRRISEDANREMINEYLLQRQNDQTETKLFQQISEGGSVQSEKSEPSAPFEKQDIAIDVPTPVTSSSTKPSRRTASGGSSKDRQNRRISAVKFKTSKDLYKTFNPDMPLDRKKKTCFKIINYFLYCGWLFISNLLVLTFFWILI